MQTWCYELLLFLTLVHSLMQAQRETFSNKNTLDPIFRIKCDHVRSRFFLFMYLKNYHHDCCGDVITVKQGVVVVYRRLEDGYCDVM